MPATTFTINKILNYNFGKTAYDPEDTIYFGLSTTLVTAASTGASVAEPATADGYAREGYDNSAATGEWTTSTVGALSNTADVVFDISTDNWGEIVSVFISNSGTRGAGDILWYYTLNPSFPVVNNTVVTFPIGTIFVAM